MNSQSTNEDCPIKAKDSAVATLAVMRKLTESEKLALLARIFLKHGETIHQLTHQSTLLKQAREGLQVILDWKFDIMGDCVSDARKVAKQALTALEGEIISDISRNGCEEDRN